MTRETKIGLLVGLAFIIVIGILLSDHLTSSMEPPLAQLAQAGPNVRSAVVAPGGQEPPVTAVEPPVRVVPEQPVPTANEVSPPPAPNLIVKVGPSAQQQPGVLQPHVTETPSIPVVPQLQTTQGQPPVANPAGVQQAGTPLNEFVRQNAEELVPVDAKPSEPSPRPAPTAAREYVVQPGDSLSEIASSQMGANTQANRDAILAANPFMKGNPNLIIAGRTYVIPATGTAPAVQARQPAPQRQSQPVQQSVASAQHEHWYTCKSGDSLWKIAQEQLGEGASYTAIKELNKDVLKGRDTVVPGMRLRLPAKPLASAE